jgi:phage terminase small subunit
MPRKTTHDEAERRRRFVEAFTGEASGNALRAAELAGFRDPKAAGVRLMREAGVLQAIERARKEAQASSGGAIMSRDERWAMWSRWARGEKIRQVVMGVEVEVAPPAALQLKASELLGKAQGDFVERHEHKHTGTVTIWIPDNGRDPQA